MKRIAIVVAALSVPLVTAACGHRNHHGSHTMSAKQIDRKVEFAADYLDADENQRALFKKKATEIAVAALVVRADRDQLRQTVLAQWNKSQPDRKAMHGLVDKKSKQLVVLAHQVVDALVDIHRDLTPAQRQKIAKLIRKHD